MGTAFGLGYNYSPKVTVGALMGVSLTSYDLANNNGNGTVNNYYTGLYTTYGRKEGFILKASAIMGYSQYKGERKMNTLSLVAKNSHTGWNGALRVQGGYGISVNTFSIEPFTALGYSMARQRAYQENNADAFNLSVPESTTQVLRPEVGLKLQTSFTAHETIFQPLVTGSIVKEYPIRKSASATLRFSDSTDTFQTPVPNETKTFGLLSVGCVAVLKNNLSLSGMVSGKISRHEQGAEIMAKASYAF
jgi:outer membrane autotransporter protein